MSAKIKKSLPVWCATLGLTLPFAVQAQGPSPLLDQSLAMSLLSVLRIVSVLGVFVSVVALAMAFFNLEDHHLPGRIGALMVFAGLGLGAWVCQEFMSDTAPEPREVFQGEPVPVLQSTSGAEPAQWNDGGGIR